MRLRRDILADGVILLTVKLLSFTYYGSYETAITFDNQKSWSILKGYKTEVEAIKWHEKFKNMPIKELMYLEKLD